jgi:uncharacterized membrane-anchored protein YitT (DUF2179 family)
VIGMGTAVYRRIMSLPPRTILLLEYIEILVGSAIIALSFNLFLLPNKLVAGGISGLSTIL